MLFFLPDMNISNIYTNIKGTYYETNFDDFLDDMSYNIICNANIYYLNKIFLFYINDDNNNLNNEYNDLTDFVETDFKYAFHTEQWNPSFETTKNDRKYVIGNYLSDIFGNNTYQALQNIDVLSNETDLDNDIYNIFNIKLQETQKQIIYDNSFIHGAFNNPYDLNSIITRNGNTYNDISSTNINSLTYKLLLQAYNKQKIDNNTNVFKRQFGTQNNSDKFNNLPNGWRTFIFQEDDTIKFNLIIKQKNTAFPLWSYNQNALIGNSTPTKFSITINIKNNPVQPIARFKPLPQFVNEIIMYNNNDISYNYTIISLNIYNELFINEYGLVLDNEQLYDTFENRIYFNNINFY